MTTISKNNLVIQNGFHFLLLMTFLASLFKCFPFFASFHLLFAVMAYRFSFDMKCFLNTWCDSKLQVKNTQILNEAFGLTGHFLLDSSGMRYCWGLVRCHFGGKEVISSWLISDFHLLNEGEPGEPLNRYPKWSAYLLPIVFHQVWFGLANVYEVNTF